VIEPYFLLFNIKANNTQSTRYSQQQNSLKPSSNYLNDSNGINKELFDFFIDNKKNIIYHRFE